MTMLDWVQVSFLVIVIVIGVGGIIYVVTNEENDK